MIKGGSGDMAGACIHRYNIIKCQRSSSSWKRIHLHLQIPAIAFNVRYEKVGQLQRGAYSKKLEEFFSRFNILVSDACVSTRDTSAGGTRIAMI
jgi:hypothetical protein